MALSILRLIPTSPTYSPTAEQVGEVMSLLQLTYPELHPKVDARDEIEFIDQGGNFEYIRCPCCGFDIKTDWWQEAMSQAYLSRFRNLSITCPICGCSTSLNDLIYHLPAGFARFSISFVDPEADLDPETIEHIGSILNVGLRRIWARY